MGMELKVNREQQFERWARNRKAVAGILVDPLIRLDYRR